MVQNLGIGVLAGLVSALLFGMLIKATPLAIILYLLAPLPILIVGLGWSHKAGLAAVAAGSLALALAFSPFLGIGFAAYLAVPAWWLGYLALLGRPNADGSLEWYPVGRLLAWVAGTAALAFVAIAVIAAPNYETFRSQIGSMAKRVVQTQMQGRGLPTPPAKQTPQSSGETPAPAQEPSPDAKPQDMQEEVSDALATVAPGLAAQGLTILLALYLWLAARIVKISGRLIRPWPDIPSTQMPRNALIVLAAAFALAMVPGYAGVLGVALIGALSAAFALQGLAAFHDRSRGRPARGALLFGLYMVLFITQGLAFVALTLFGIADTALARRVPATGHPGGPRPH
ncbi:DUF2232 domain-containing protein [Methylobacterium gnaphalii]|uniref:Membrane protein n=1 Tax=Methylobacterium gnaphalii TaxID=1010610 RepID=A0A512JMD6_9HYPH|nr:DUF2232 domain-containing protein [Methylobacterium gnaphalii]GEP11013.1 membrane protein [Methylobacterium gnaphalii]GJD69647.1 hypothetical protein MMMDOFMJ_2584 [Methylobacterium gnaphalii]GLS50291.1 membrane protein [Methylobacterium gnaphalii]